MKNINQLMKQAQAMQTKMAEAQDALSKHHETGQSGGGLVKVTLTAKGDIVSLNIHDSVIKDNQKDFLEDLLIAAFNDAKKKADLYANDKMNCITGGVSVPGLF